MPFLVLIVLLYIGIFFIQIKLVVILVAYICSIIASSDDTVRSKID